MWTSSVNYVSLTVMFLCYQYVIGTTSQDRKSPEIGVSPSRVPQLTCIWVGLQEPGTSGLGNLTSQPLWGWDSLSPTSVNVWIAWNTYFLIIAKANSKFGKKFIFLYHCIFGQSFYAVQWAVHPTNCDIVYKQTATWLEKNKSNFKFSEASSLVGFGWLVVGFAMKVIFSPSPPPLMTTIATNL